MPTEQAIQALLEQQRAHFFSGRTLPVQARIQALDQLEQAILDHEEDLYRSLQADLGKSRMEAFLCEISLTLSELRYVRRHVKGWSRRRPVLPSLAQFPGRCSVLPEPYGVVLILSPWNYPVLLTLEPLIGAIAAGNCAVVKPSAYSPNTSAVLAALIGEAFPPEHAAVVEGGRHENQSLLSQPFDYIFFTGSVAVGREVMTKAAAHLTPVTLELGGKSPCIVDETANIPLAARRIVFGKFINCGQTCVAPDYIYCAPAVKDRLIAALKKELERQYGKNALENPDYGKIINQKHFDRICGLIDPAKVVCGGGSDPETCRIQPTILDRVTWEDKVMGEEIFGPVLPVLTYDSLEQVTEKVNSMDSPLALYLFSSSKEHIRYITSRIQYGGGCVNDTLIHLATSAMGFGGVGASGMGAYHGKVGFDTFTHYKSMVDKKTFLDLPMRYQPYTKLNEMLVRLFVR